MKDLLSTAVGLWCANKEDASVLGVFSGKVLDNDDCGNSVAVQSLVYVIKHGGDLLSREVLKQLGVLPPDPKICQYGSPQGEKGRLGKVIIGGNEDKAAVEMFRPHSQRDPPSRIPENC